MQKKIQSETHTENVIPHKSGRSGGGKRTKLTVATYTMQKFLLPTMQQWFPSSLNKALLHFGGQNFGACRSMHINVFDVFNVFSMQFEHPQVQPTESKTSISEVEEMQLRNLPAW